jgi:hypothetical protein
MSIPAAAYFATPRARTSSDVKPYSGGVATPNSQMPADAVLRRPSEEPALNLSNRSRPLRMTQVRNG